MSEETQATPEVNTVEVLNTTTNEVETVPVNQPEPAKAEAKPQEDDGESTQVESGGESDKPKGKNWHARKIDDLTRRLHQAEREKQQLFELAAGKQQPEPPPQPMPPQSEYAGHPGFDPRDPEPNRDSFDSYEKFVEQRAAWASRMEFRAMTVAQQQQQLAWQQQQRIAAEAQQAREAFVKNREEFVKSVPDWDETVANLDIPSEAAPAMTKAIFTSSNPSAILYTLGKNKEIAYQIAQAPPDQQFRAIALIEAHAMAQKSPISNAPEPPSSVSGGKATSRASYRDDFSVEEHLAWKKANGIK